MSNRYECCFCNNTFKTEAVMLSHQRRAKYCLKLQYDTENLDIVEDIEATVYKCEFCNKSFLKKLLYTNHTRICKKDPKNSISYYKNIINNIEQKYTQKIIEIETKYQHIIKEMEQKLAIAVLETKLENQNERVSDFKELFTDDRKTIREIAQQPRNNNNNTTNTVHVNLAEKLSPMISQEEINRIVEEKYTKEYFVDGQYGLAQFAVENICIDKENKTNRMACTNLAQNVFKTVDEKKNLIEDIGAAKFRKQIAHPAEKKAMVLIQQEQNHLFESDSDSDDEKEEKRSREFDSNMDVINFMLKRLDDIRSIRAGDSKCFDFIKVLKSKLRNV